MVDSVADSGKAARRRAIQVYFDTQGHLFREFCRLFGLTTDLNSIFAFLGTTSFSPLGMYLDDFSDGIVAWLVANTKALAPF